MRPNQLLFLIALLFFRIGYSQEIRISKSLPESDYQFVGIWKSKIFSCKTFMEMELTIVDTSSENSSKQVMKIAPHIEKAKKTGGVYYFIHDQFLYEVYFVIPKIVRGESFSGYNVIVKRDLETMKIVAQKQLNHLFPKVKLVKLCNDGFYFCFGISDNIYYSSPANQVYARKLYGFNYNLEELWSTDFDNFFVQGQIYEDDISFDEDNYILIPGFNNGGGEDEEGKPAKPKVIFNVAHLKGFVAKMSLEVYGLDEYLVNSVKVKYDERNKRIRGILMISKPNANNTNLMDEWGYFFAEWNEDGKLINSNLKLINKREIFSENIIEYANRVKLNIEEISTFKMDSNIGYFKFLDNGDALYIANNICKGLEEKLVHSKFIVCISNKGELKWSLLIPYNGNQLYENAYYVSDKQDLHVYTREFAKNFESGRYIFEDTREGLNGESIIMSERIINLKTGEINSHKPIVDQKMGKYVPSWRIYRSKFDEYIFRFRYTQKNLEKLVFIQF